MKKQQFMRTLLATLLIALLGFYVETVLAQDRGHAGTRSSSRDHGGNERGEQNHDNDLQSGEWSSEYQSRPGTNINEIGIGQPTDPDNGYNQSKEFLKDHR